MGSSELDPNLANVFKSVATLNDSFTLCKSIVTLASTVNFPLPTLFTVPAPPKFFLLYCSARIPLECLKILFHIPATFTQVSLAPVTVTPESSFSGGSAGVFL